MKRTYWQCLFALVVAGTICSSTVNAHAGWGYEVPVVYGPVVAYHPVIVAEPVFYRRPAVVYSAPYVYGGYGYIAGPRVVRDRYNYGAFGHLNHHHHERGGGFGHSHYHARYPYSW